MELIQKKYKEIEVTDFEVVFLGATTDMTRLGPDDSTVEDGSRFTFSIRHPQTKMVIEEITYLKRNMLSYRFVKRLIRVEDK